MRYNIELSNEELVKAYQDASETEVKEEIIGIMYQKNIGLIRKIACRYSAFESIEDLMQEGGYFGMKTAIELYDPDHESESSFANYAYQWIRQAMKRYLDNCGNCMRIPTHRSSTIYKFDKILNSFMIEIGREPSDNELCQLLGITKNQLEEVKTDKLKLKINSIYETIPGEDESITIADTIADDHDRIGDIIEVDYNERLSLVLWDEVAKIGNLELDVLKQCYKYHHTMEQTAAALGIEVQDVRTAKARAFRALRKNDKLKPYRDEIYESKAYRRVSISGFMRNHMSSTEYAALDDLDDEIRRIKSDIYNLVNSSRKNIVLSM